MSMNSSSTCRICGYIVLTGGLLALGMAFGMMGLLLAGVILLMIAWSLFHDAGMDEASEAAEREELTREATNSPSKP